MDAKLQEIINEVRETLGIDPKDEHFNREAGILVMKHILNKKIVSDFTELGIDIVMTKLPDIMKQLGIGRASATMGNVGSQLSAGATLGAIGGPIGAIAGAIVDNKLPALEESEYNWFFTTVLDDVSIPD